VPGIWVGRRKGHNEARMRSTLILADCSPVQVAK
jgi:hypothetical protein